MALNFSQPEVRLPPGAGPNAKRCKSNQNARLPFRQSRNQMAAEALDNSSLLFKHAAHDVPSESDYHAGTRMALQTQAHNRGLLAKTADRRGRGAQGLGPLAFEPPSQSWGHQRTHTV